MGKPYHFRTLIRTFVVLVMLSCSFLTIFFFSLLRATRLVPSAFFATVWMPVVLMLVVNIISATVYILLVPKLIRPIESLIGATEKVAKGDFTVQIPSDDLEGEVKELVESFNSMTRELGNTEIFRSDFIRDFSHEFKTPIVSMMGFAKQLKNPDLSPEEREQYCDIIISESARLAGMSSNILLLSNFENQEIISDKRPYRLDEQLRDAVLLLEREWSSKNLELDLELDPVIIESNPDVLKHVWTNLISNAVKFTPEKGSIFIKACENSENILVTVKDTGIGMTEEQMKHIFERCYQADSSHSGAGNGLGLCIAQRVCRLSGGDISVRSAPGKGSVFTVLLPK